ncbi:MAG: MoaD/ThiS family protein [Dehalococcoidales bacterium]
MSININISPFLSPYADGRQIIEVNGSTVGQCLDHLVKQFPGVEQRLFDNNGKLHNYIDIYVNGRSAYPEELTKPIKSGDELYILFMVAGG